MKPWLGTGGADEAAFNIEACPSMFVCLLSTRRELQ